MNEDTKLVERAAKAGFTLIEIIIAIAIVGIMAAVAVPSINKYISRARVTACRQLIQTAHQATVTYSLDHSGKVPDSQDAWVTALTGGDEPDPGDDPNPGSAGTYKLTITPAEQPRARTA